jgi:predicted Na+-dependent transporter
LDGPAVKVYTLGISDAMFKTISSVVIPIAVAFLLNRAYRAWDQHEVRATLWLGAICLVLIVIGVAIALDTKANEKDDIRRADFLSMEKIGPVSEP